MQAEPNTEPMTDSAGIGGVIDSVRKPEYTGENRCTPCTIVNLAIAGATTLVLAFIYLPLAAAFLPTSLLMIYLRGYLVPYTPQITKQYFPDRVLRLFDKHESTATAMEQAEEVDVEQLLQDLEVVEECSDVDDLCLTPEFQREWRERMSELDRDTTYERISEVLDVSRNELRFDDYGDAIVVLIEDRRVAQWESGSALRADVAAEQLLDDRPGWDELDPVSRSKLLNSLRIFLEECPSCGGAIQMGQETVESCCRSIDVVAVTCGECGDRLFEAEYPDAA